MAALTLYYDGNCRLCRAQMSRLRVWDKERRLAFADIAAPDFSPRSLGVSMEALGTEIHALTADGRLLVGIDSIVAAYVAVGHGWRIAPLRVRVLRPMFSALYRSLACNRYRVSAWLGKPVCMDDVCRMRDPL